MSYTYTILNLPFAAGIKFVDLREWRGNILTTNLSSHSSVDSYIHQTTMYQLRAATECAITDTIWVMNAWPSVSSALHCDD